MAVFDASTFKIKIKWTHRPNLLNYTFVDTVDTPTAVSAGIWLEFYSP